MGNYNASEMDYQNVGGGWAGGMGGGFVWFILILVFAWFMIGGRRDGFGDGGHGHGDCGIRGCRPAYYDESNYEQDRFNTMQYEKIMAGQAKAQEKADERYILALRDKNTEKDIIIADKNAEIREAKMYAYFNEKFCGIPKARPEYACTTAACATAIPVCNGEVRRGNCDFYDYD